MTIRNYEYTDTHSDRNLIKNNLQKKLRTKTDDLLFILHSDERSS